MGVLTGIFSGVETVWAQTALDAEKVYTIRQNKTASNLKEKADVECYLKDLNEGVLYAPAATDLSDAALQWMFEPSGKENCYYVKNVATGNYIQQTNTKSVAIAMGSTKVELMVAQDGKDGATTQGYYFLASTEGQNMSGTDAEEPLGLNFDNPYKKGIANPVDADFGVIGWVCGSGRGNSYWVIEECVAGGDNEDGETDVYTISLNPSKSNIAPEVVYIEDDGSGLMTATSYSKADKYHWYLEPTENDDCYYIKNVATGNYMQSSKNMSTQLQMGKEPVEFKIAKDQLEGSGTTGYYYLCSTDQTVDNTTDGTLGLNYEKSGNKVIGYYIKSGRGNSYWEVKKLEEGGTEPEPEPESPLTPVTDGAFSAEKYYAINRMNMDGAFMMENNAGELYTTTFNDAERVFWKLIPTGKANCYYVQNATTGRYVQSTKQNLSAQIPMGSNPVEIQIGKDGTSGASTNGTSFYYFCSTDQNNIPSGALGLNLNGSKAGANVVAWSAASGNQNSYWTVSETEYTYEPQILPLVESLDDAATAAKYALAVKDGKWLAAENGSVSLAEKGTDNKFAWFFVGTSNKKEGIYLVNMADPTKVLTLNDDGSYGFAETEQGTRWFVAEKVAADGSTTLTFVPYTQKDDAEPAYLTIGGVSEFVLANYRSGYSLATQIYFLPCGVLDEGYIASLNLTGEQVLKELNYEASKPSNYYTLYTVEKATVARGESFNLAAQLSGMGEGTVAYVYFDWNRDGLFETVLSYDTDEIADEIEVPEDAVVGKSRMRVRITNNALTDAEDDAVGSIYDFIVNIAEPQAKRLITVKPNGADRGTAAILVGEEQLGSYEANYGETVTASATPANDLEFVCWKDNRTVVSADAEYSFTVTEHADLVACFTPNSTFETDIQNTEVAQKNLVYELVQGTDEIQVVTDADVKMVYVFAANGTLVGKSASKKVSVGGMLEGTYIVKVVTAVGDGSKKIVLK